MIASPIKVFVGIKSKELKTANLVEVDTEQTVAQLKERACGQLASELPLEECLALRASSFSDSLEDQQPIGFYEMKNGTPVMME